MIPNKTHVIVANLKLPTVRPARTGLSKQARRGIVTGTLIGVSTASTITAAIVYADAGSRFGRYKEAKTPGQATERYRAANSRLVTGHGLLAVGLSTGVWGIVRMTALASPALQLSGRF